MKIVALLLIGWSSYRLGKSNYQVRSKLAFATVALAAILHTVLGLLLPHDAIERLAADFAWTAKWDLVLTGVALLETVGVWATALLVPWASVKARLATSAYFIGASLAGSGAYYQPFDGPTIVDGVRLGPTHPQYEAAWALSLVFGIVPFLVGFSLRRRKNVPQFSKASREASSNTTA